MNQTKSKLKPNHPVRAMLGRDFRLFLREVPVTLLIAVLLGLFCVMAVTALSHGSDSTYTRAPVAIVDEGKSFTGSMTIAMLANQDFAAPMEIIKTTAEQAQAGLEDGTYSAALFLPKDYMEDILVGNPVSARAILSESVPLHGDVLRLLCSFGEELLSTGQFGIFAGETLVLEKAPDRHSAYLKKSNALFMGQAFADPEFQREQTSYSMTGMQAQQWYMVVYAAAFFQLLILGCFFVTRDCRGSILRRLKAEGISSAAFLGSKFGILLLLDALVFVGIAAAMKLEINALGAASALAVLLMSASLGLAAVICLNRSSAVIAVTALTAAGVFASGGILPRMELPEIVTTIGDFLPVGAAAKASGILLGAPMRLEALLICLGWAAAAWAVLALRMRKGAFR